jgi:predicted RNase H-like nuclease (RuvC/YqgF family)
MQKFDTTVLLKIYRKYTLDESVLFLKDTISQLRVEIGQLKSEIDEHKYVNRQLHYELAGCKIPVSADCETDEYIQALKNTLKEEIRIKNEFRLRCKSFEMKEALAKSLQLATGSMEVKEIVKDFLVTV